MISTAIHLNQVRVHPESCECEVHFPGLVNAKQGVCPLGDTAHNSPKAKLLKAETLPAAYKQLCQQVGLCLGPACLCSMSVTEAQRPHIERLCLENGARLVQPRGRSGRWHRPKPKACSPARGWRRSKAEQKNSWILAPKLHVKVTCIPQHVCSEHKPDPASKSLTYKPLLALGFPPAED